MIKKLLTIVVPVYKVEPYINKCLDSCILADEKLMSQLEVIIVNDGTPDRSAEMSREYVKRYPETFRQIDKENGGHGSAWNVGLKEANGKYLRFLDSDDWLTNLDKLMEKLAHTNADLVFTDECVHYYEGENETNTIIQNCSTEYEDLLYIKEQNMSEILVDAACINFRKCTYKAFILQRQIPLFREKVSYDDTILHAAPFLYAETMIAFNIVVYNLYRGREEQSMNANVIRKKADQIVQAYIDLHQYIHDKVFYESVKEMVYSTERKIYGWCFYVVSQLEYRRRKQLLKKLLKNSPNNYHGGKSYRRYKNWPFICAYIWDNIRKVRQTLF